MGKTSTVKKQKWRDENLKQINIALPKELVIKWEDKLAKTGMAKAAFFREAIEQFMISEK